MGTRNLKEKKTTLSHNHSKEAVSQGLLAVGFLHLWVVYTCQHTPGTGKIHPSVLWEAKKEYDQLAQSKIIIAQVYLRHLKR